uniref:BIRC2/3-like UBA domain-containing protein n=1 Tax=Hucho hucho TaxID=62062 RepID=A0A4W5KJA9_9TELE
MFKDPSSVKTGSKLSWFLPLQLLTNGDSISREFVDPPMLNLGPGEERSEDAVMMNTPVVVSALEMGFERGLVKQTVQSKILTSGENYKTVQELVSDLLSAEDQKREEEKEMLAEEMASGMADMREGGRRDAGRGDGFWYG